MDELKNIRTNELSTTELVAQVRALEALDLKSIPIAELQERVRSLLNHIPLIGLKLHGVPRVFRARKNPPSGMLFGKVGLLGPPPASSLTVPGRCNDAGEPVFYSSLDFGTALFEVRPKPGDFVTFTRYRIARTAEAVEVGWSDLNLEDDEFLKNLRRAAHTQSIDNLKLTRTGFRNVLIVRGWATNDYTKLVLPGEEYKYRSSVAMTRYLLDVANDGKSDAVIYPSIERALFGANLVSRTDRVGTLFVPESCSVVRVGDLEKSFPHVAMKPYFDGTFDAEGNVTYKPLGDHGMPIRIAPES